MLRCAIRAGTAVAAVAPRRGMPAVCAPLAAARSLPLAGYAAAGVLRTSAPVRHATISANEVREGNLLEMDNGLWRVVKREFSRTAAGRAYVQMELRHLTESIKRDMRFRSDEMVEQAALDSPVRYQVLYSSGDTITLMHPTTYEQIELNGPVALGEGARYVHDGMVLTVEAYKGAPAVVQLPSRVSVRVLELDAGGGDGAMCVPVNPDADAPPEEGAPLPPGAFKVRVPKFVKRGDRLTIDTEGGKYVGRE